MFETYLKDDASLFSGCTSCTMAKNKNAVGFSNPSAASVFCSPSVISPETCRSERD